MKKSIKSVLAKSLAVTLAFSLAGIAPSTSSDAAAKKPTVTKKMTVTVGKTKTVKVTSKKKVKKTTWSLTKKGKKIVSLSKKTKKSVKIKGKKAGKATLTAKIKVGKKTYKASCKITVKKGGTVKTTTPTKNPGTTTPAPTAASTGTSNATPTPPAGSNNTPTPKPVGDFMSGDTKLTVDEDATYNITLTSLNETTFTCADKRSDGETNTEVTSYNRDGSVTFTSKGKYNSGVSYYINPCTSEDDIVDISDTRGDGFFGYKNGTKDMSAYDYIRLEVTSENELNLRTYNGNDQINSVGFPGSSTSETYEGGWAHTTAEKVWTDEATHEAGNTIKPEYVKRTVFIPISALIEKGCDPSTLTAIAFCPQSSGVEVTIHRIDFVKVNYDKPVTKIDVTAKKTQLDKGKVTTCTAAITPADATRKIVKWSSSDETLATVNYQGAVSAAADKEGTVTITAEATDGSGVKGTVQIQIGGTVQATPTPVPDAGSPTIAANGDVTLTLSAAEIKASSNTGNDVVTSNISKTDKGIEYAGAYTMQMLDISAYLEKYGLDLSNYTGITIEGKLLDADGEEVTCGAGKVKTALVKKANLNGYGDGINSENSEKYKNFPTISLDISEKEAADLAAAVGFNFQIASDWDDFANYKTMVISSIKLTGAKTTTTDPTQAPAATQTPDANAPVVNGDSVTLALAADEIVAKTNPGEGASITSNITKTDKGIEYAGAYTMLMLDISAYLEKYELDLADYKGITIEGNLLDKDGEVVACAAGKVKTALVNQANLNGYGESMLKTGQYKNFPTIELNLEDKDLEATTLAGAVGFNFQIASTIGGDGEDKNEKWDGFDDYQTMLISSIKLIKKTEPTTPTEPTPIPDTKPIESEESTTLVLAADEIVAKTNPGEGPSITSNITKTDKGIEYAGAYTMLMLDISAYLDKYELDLADYKGITIEGNLLDKDGEVVACAAGKVKTALVNQANLNGYGESMLKTGQYKNFPTIELNLEDKDLEATTLAGAVGFNFQIASTIGGDGEDKNDKWAGFDDYQTMLISSIKLIKKTEPTV